MNPYIDEDLQALADTARRFAEERVKPGFLERDKTRDLDRALLREMGELGFICPELPEQFGGLGMGCLAAELSQNVVQTFGFTRVLLQADDGQAAEIRYVRYESQSGAGWSCSVTF